MLYKNLGIAARRGTGGASPVRHIFERVFVQNGIGGGT